jgi:hypothetical protein
VRELKHRPVDGPGVALLGVERFAVVGAREVRQLGGFDGSRIVPLRNVRNAPSLNDVVRVRLQALLAGISLEAVLGVPTFVAVGASWGK